MTVTGKFPIVQWKEIPIFVGKFEVLKIIVMRMIYSTEMVF